MKYVYLIMSEQYMPQIENHSPYGVTDFAFTSEKQANKQIDTIVELVNQDKFYRTKGHRVAYDTHIVDLRNNAILRRIKVDHPNGTFTIFTLQKCELNSGYGI